MEYKIHSSDFVKRARKYLDEGTPDSLVHAALELRLGIEARLDRYHDALEELNIKIKRGWRIHDLDKNLEKAFKLRKMVVQILIIDNKTGRVIQGYYYTPVSEKLIKNGEKIGNLLHYNKLNLSRKDEWYDETKEFLEETYSELVKANKGTLLAPPMYNPKTNHSKLFFDIRDDFNPKNNTEEIELKYVIMKVDYLDEYPE